jgi:hypothetical protein
VTAPAILLCRIHKTCANWIQVNVPNQAQQLDVGFDQYGSVSTFKEMPAAAEATVYGTCVAEGEIMHDRADRPVANLQDQVDVVGHPAVAQSSKLVALAAFGQ